MIRHILRIERERRRLKADTTPWHEQTEHGAGSKFASSPRTVGDVARQSSTPLWKCLILYWFARRADVVIELGTGLGLSTSYLSAGCDWVKTYDLDITALNIARQHLNKQNPSAISTQCDFDSAISMNADQIFYFTLAYIDGDHTGIALKRYFTKLIPLMAPGSVIIIDDVLWSDDMHYGYLECCTNKNVKRHMRIHDLGIIWLR